MSPTLVKVHSHYLLTKIINQHFWEEISAAFVKIQQNHKIFNFFWIENGNGPLKERKTPPALPPPANIIYKYCTTTDKNLIGLASDS